MYERRFVDEPLATLAQLFLLNRPVGRDRVESVLAPDLIDGSLLRAEGDRVVATAMITPFAGVLVASDPRPEREPDHVPGISRSTATAAALAVRRPVASALDLGTGSGALALLAAGHSDRVTATDVNSRAFAFGRLSAQLSGVESVEWREGSLYAPVEGEQFDYIGCNAPFVVSPDFRFAFRDSGLPGGEFSAELVRQAPNHLAEGGFAALTVSWPLREAQDWTEPLREWIRESGCDAWLLRYSAADPLTHAAVWNRPLDGADPAAFAQTLDRWVAHFESAGVSQIVTGTVLLRRRSGGTNWIRADDLPPGPFRPASDHVLRVFANQDVLERSGEEAIRRTPLVFAAPHSLRSTERGDGEWIRKRARLYLRDGLRFRLDLDERTLAVLPRLDGQTPLSDLDTDPPLAEIRRLVELGFLTFAGAHREDRAEMERLEG